MKRANKSFFAEGNVLVERNTLLADDDPVVEGREELFDHFDLAADASAEIEALTTKLAEVEAERDAATARADAADAKLAEVEATKGKAKSQA